MVAASFFKVFVCLVELETNLREVSPAKVSRHEVWENDLKILRDRQVGFLCVLKLPVPL